jgi:hypothetical protein
LTATAAADTTPADTERAPWAKHDTHDQFAFELTHGWGSSVDNYAFSGRLEREGSSEFVSDAFGVVASAGKLGDATSVSAGVTGAVGIGAPMLAARLEGGYGFDHDAFVRGSIGVRYHFLEVGYARQESLDDRMGWLAPNQLYVSFAAPFDFDFLDP